MARKKNLELSPVIPFCTKHEATSFILGYFVTPAYFLNVTFIFSQYHMTIWKYVLIYIKYLVKVHERLLKFNCCLRPGISTLKTPVLVRSPQLSNVEPGQYLDGWPPGNTGCCRHFYLIFLSFFFSHSVCIYFFFGFFFQISFCFNILNTKFSSDCFATL